MELRIDLLESTEAVQVLEPAHGAKLTLDPVFLQPTGSGVGLLFVLSAGIALQHHNEIRDLG
jgi:hypothetical protein